MKSIFTLRVILLVSATFGWKIALLAQNVNPQAHPDTMRVIQIIQGKSLREKNIDSLTSLQTIAGDVILKEGLTIFYCDSASIDKTTNILEAFGNIHINQNDSIHTYSQYLKYIGRDRMAYLKKEVRLTDNKGTLFTDELEYDLKSSIGKYYKGGKVVNGKTVLTSTEGVYYADTKDVYFKKNVHLVDPKYDVRNDTLLYNTQTQVTSWNTPTVIKSKNGGDVYSSNGTYDLKNGKAFFGNRTIIVDSTRTYVADNMASDDSTGIAQLKGNAIIKDSTNGYSVLGHEIYIDKKYNTFLATGKPVLIFKGEGKDSTFIAADTLFSGIEKRDSLGRKIIVSRDTIRKDTVANAPDSLLAARLAKDSMDQKGLVKSERLKDTSVANKSDSTIAKSDSINNKLLAQAKPADDTTAMLKRKNFPALKELEDSIKNQAITKKDSVQNKTFVQHGKTDSVLNRQDKKDSVANRSLTKKDSVSGKTPVQKNAAGDSAVISKTDSAATIAITKGPVSLTDSASNDTTGVHVLKDTAIRYFIAFHHVRIFNDSLQSVCDSLYYSSEDSIFRLFQEPLVFSNNSQIAGDTIFLYTKNKKPARLYAFENGIIINKANEKMYNQIAGRTLNGYFKGGELDYMRAKGSPAESIYYPQDEDSAYIGMNRGKGDVIDVYFLDKAVHKVKFINDVDGTLFPLRQIPEDKKFLKNYKWLDARRPKNKLELFE